jgi:hypothetical protein
MEKIEHINFMFSRYPDKRYLGIKVDGEVRCFVEIDKDSKYWSKYFVAVRGDIPYGYTTNMMNLIEIGWCSR